MSYLENLTLRLAAGAGSLPREVQARHAAYLAGRQNADGGFADRRGSSDLYYTSFALRGLAVLDRLTDRVARRVAGFLKDAMGTGPICRNGPKGATHKLDLSPWLPGIDFLSLLFGAVLVEMAIGVDVFDEAGRDRRQTVIDSVERFRRDDGGYAKTQRGARGSTYHTFLAVACKQLVGAPLQGAERMIELVRSRQRDDGGFVEIDQIRHSGTNPTAAAVGLLRILDGLDEPTRAAAAGFLADMQSEEGGLRANTRVPVADLLSTFTGLAALADLEATSLIDTAAVRRFAESLERPDGGFRAGAFEDAVDVEYTFYGLGTLALLAATEG